MGTVQGQHASSVVGFQQSPELSAALREQLREYQVAVQATYPQAAVKAAFITALGRWVEL